LVAVTHIMVPLAKGAIKDSNRHVYLDIDKEVARRIDDAVSWSEELTAEGQQLWVFGAGTAVAYRNGPTLGALMGKYLQWHYNHLHFFSNEEEKKFYGTLEEIQWVVDQVKATFSSTSDYRFVFFTQARHMGLVELIWRLFHQRRWGKATFVVVPHDEEISWWHVVKSTARIWLVYWGVRKARYAKSYPSVTAQV